MQRVKRLDRSSGSRNVSRVACAFDERGNKNGKGRSRTINVCHVSRVFDITKRKLLGYFDTGQRNRRRNERRFLVERVVEKQGVFFRRSHFIKREMLLKNYFFRIGAFLLVYFLPKKY